MELVPLFWSWLYQNELCDYEFVTSQDLGFYICKMRQLKQVSDKGTLSYDLLPAFSLSWSCISSCSQAFVYLRVPLVFEICYQSHPLILRLLWFVPVPTVRTEGLRGELLESRKQS